MPTAGSRLLEFAQESGQYLIGMVLIVYKNWLKAESMCIRLISKKKWGHIGCVS